MTPVDAVVIGAGTAGCSFALNAGRFAHVLLIDRQPAPQPRAGESLPPAANKLLQDMGLWDDFIRQGHLPHYGNRSVWGGPAVQETDFLRDPAGIGWHLDRPRFERWLQQKAVERGATLWTDTRLAHIEPTPNGQWLVTVSRAGAVTQLVTPLLVDASGRNPVVARHLGAKRIQTDQLVCAWALGNDHPHNPQGLSYLEARQEGWWYTAPVPGNKRIIAFHTDGNSPMIASMRSAGGFQQLLLTRRNIPEHLNLAAFYQTPAAVGYGTTAAHSAYTAPGAGRGWLAVGDAALSMDPLSSQGLFNALYTGLAGAESAYRLWRGEIADFSAYARLLDSIWRAYQQHLTQWYGAEQRWPDAPFWRNRGA